MRSLGTTQRPLRQVTAIKSDEASLAGLLPYWEFDRDVVVLGDGSIATGLQLMPQCIEAWDSGQINDYCLQLRSFLNSLEDRIEATLLVSVQPESAQVLGSHEAMPCDGSPVHFLTERRVDGLRAEIAAGHVTRKKFFLLLYQRAEATEKRSLWKTVTGAISAPALFSRERMANYHERLGQLRQTLNAIKGSFSSLGIETAALDEREIWDLVYRFLNPTRSVETASPKLSAEYHKQEFGPEELALEPGLVLPSPREQLVYSDVVVGYQGVFLDGLHHRVITLKSLPEFSHAAMVSRLLRLPFAFELSLNIRVPDQSRELASLQVKRRMAHSMSHSLSGRASDLESEAKLQSTEEAIRDILQSGQKIFYGQLVVIVRDADERGINLKVKRILSAFREASGMEGALETTAALPVWKSCLPFGHLGMVRPKRMKTDNLSDLLPLYSDFQGASDVKPVCLFRNRSDGLVSYDPFHPQMPNFNTLVTGSSGAGKSFTNNLILMQQLALNPMVFVIDIGGSYKKLCELMGGQYIDLVPPRDGETVMAVNPFAQSDYSLDPSPQKIKLLLSFLQTILTDEDAGRLPKIDRSLLEEEILKLYAAAKVTSKEPVLSDLVAQLRQSKQPSLLAFATMLFPWTGDRPYGRLVDRPSQFDVRSDFVVFDLKGLSSYPDLQASMLLILTDFILGKVEDRSPAVAGRKKMILMDEAWQLLKSPASADFMEYCVRTLRKSGSGITFITQGLDEIITSPVGPAILANTATKFILMQRGDLDPVKKVLKLNEQELELITSLRQVKGVFSEAFLIVNDLRGVIRIVPGAEEYWIATSDSNDHKRIDEVRQRHPELSIREVIEQLSKGGESNGPIISAS